MNLSKEYLENLYITDKLNVSEISRFLDINYRKLYRIMKGFDIDISMKKSVNLKYKEVNIEVLKELYVNKKKSIVYLSKKFNRSQKYIRELLRNEDIEFRDSSYYSKGELNPMFGKTVYDTWIKKYGKDIATEKYDKYKAYMSSINTGENNPMFGKPSPKGSGNGLQGWYKDFYFRSVYELKFILVCERFNLDIKSAENNKYKISYLDFNKTKRNYYPDYIVNDLYLIEVKPKQLHNVYEVNEKKKFAKEFCKKNNLKYKLIDYGIIEKDDFFKMYENNIINLNKKTKEKYKAWKKLNN